ncbi:hypothetical protein Pmar_PMAR024357 [Perkinsus marinus ATCC 50983]|uniref:Tubulin--tyrosine ligase-like protein 5 n=1 Tax=Perkinsus marinus (strain ATCC 50983 / TXsc) TaxID=423536 RepID=C5LML9_PERM5|nr:hypothetical protein Pmar_PMAR024357 [Perkinsus marinus ATCC 50983]EER02036.1 hypothetical protein Pmar_PMAR024357 [Perkinsus marinus ATCC 50983]|eukprot:XP_002769318.1 hypothetical protein Pmar_PMAR024357 [Perkinsus marinus ATCC 50983]
MSGATLKKIAKKSGIIQKYISNPLLLNGFKCDLRLYVLTLSVDPLKIYLFEEGLVRIATLPYVHKGRSKSRYMHLTNYSVNKKNCIFVKNEDMHFFGDGSLGEFSDRGSARSECAPSVASTNMSHKWSLRELQQNLMECGLDYDKMMKDVEDVIIKTIISAEPQMATNLHRATNYTSCAELDAPVHQNIFEIYGFDILLDANLRPWLLEVNVCPSFSSSSRLDKRIKSQMIADAFTLVGFWPFDRSGGKIRVPHPGSWKPDATQKNWASIMDWHDEEQRAGGFRRIFPTRDNAEKYGKYLLTERASNLLFRLWLEAGGAKVFDPNTKEFSYKPTTIPAQMVTRASGDIDYTGRNPVGTPQRVLGVNMGNPIYKCMAFKCPKGKDLGSSVFAWARSWNVQTHPDGHDYTMVERGKPRSWDYPRVWDEISQATTNCQLDPAPLQLLALCLVAPRAISDQVANGALKDLKDHQNSDLPNNSCLLAWQDVNNKSSPSEIADAFSKFIEGCRRMSPWQSQRTAPTMESSPREKKIIEKIAELSDGTETN